ncbi:MAG: hypothetical protein WBM50_09760 [Acidimicrobiales bacterium]
MSDTVASAAVIVGGVGLVFVHYYGGSPGDPEGWFAALGFAAPFIGAGVLALVGTRRGRPALVFAAGVALIPMSVLSIVLIPLLIPAMLLMAHAAVDRFDARDLAVPLLLALGLVVVLAILVFHQDPVTWSTPEGSGSSSNIVSATEAAIAVATTSVVACIAVLSSLWVPESPP